MYYLTQVIFKQERKNRDIKFSILKKPEFLRYRTLNNLIEII